MDIQVGEYIRDCDGFIVKVNEIQDYKEDDDIWYEEKTLKGTWKSMVVKHSKNIIDLIEVGDYVNGYRILSMEDSIYENSKRILIYKNQKERYERWIYIQEHDGKIHTQDDIVEILTKEQYNANCYKLEE